MPKSSDDSDQNSSSLRTWFVLIGLSVLGSLTANGARGLLIAAGMVLVIVIIWIWRTTSQSSVSDRRVTGKAKNDDLDPLRVLSDDDIDQLREEIKAELRSRITSGTDGELSSLDALLADQKAVEKTTKR